MFINCKEVQKTMEQPTKQRTLDAYVMAFDEIKGVVKNDNVAAVILQEVARDRRAQQIRDERMMVRSGNGSVERPFREAQAKNEPATRKQLDFLKDLGVHAPAGLSRQAASELIDIGLEKRGSQ